MLGFTAGKEIQDGDQVAQLSSVSDLDYIFHPRSIAVAGASEAAESMGRVFMSALLRAGFKGPVYPLNPKGGEVLGRRVYASVEDVPGPVDHVITCVPAPFVLDFMRDCVAKRVKVVHFFTSGFGEVGSDGARIEGELVEIARAGGVRIVGPNCLGIYSPDSGLSFSSSFPTESGDVAFVSQSGGNAAQFVRLGSTRGLRFSKVVSYGNAVDLNETDFLEYCGHDPGTSIVGAYIEGVKDGRRFFRVLRDVGRKKPVVVLKGGQASDSAKVVASHTGSLLGDIGVWDTVVRQSGAIGVDSLEGLIETIVALRCYPKGLGRRLGIVSLGGGASVMATDVCAAAGLSVPELPRDVQEQLRRFIYFSSAAGSTFCNPVDAPVILFDSGKFTDILRIIASCPQIDVVLGLVKVAVAVAGMDSGETLKSLADTMIRFGKERPKPVVLVADITAGEAYPKTVADIKRKCADAALPIYPSFASAAKAISRAVEYQERRRNLTAR